MTLSSRTAVQGKTSRKKDRAVESRKPKKAWVMIFNLGAFLAGATAGYFFSKAEDKFSSFGEDFMMKIVKVLRNGGMNGEKPRTHSFSRNRQRADWDSDDSPVGDGGGYDFQEEESEDRL